MAGINGTGFRGPNTRQNAGDQILQQDGNPRKSSALNRQPKSRIYTVIRDLKTTGIGFWGVYTLRIAGSPKTSITKNSGFEHTAPQKAAGVSGSCFIVTHRLRMR